MARKIVVFLGFFVAILQYLGFPEQTDSILYTVSGLLILFLAWSGKRPAHQETIEDLERELEEVEEDHPINHLGENVPQQEKSSKDVPMPEPSHHVSPVEVPLATLPSESINKETPLSVSFEKKRVRHIKKQVIEKAPQSPTTEI